MGGAALAFALKDCGLRVLVIERGGYLAAREAENASVDAVFRQKRYRSVESGPTARASLSIPASTTMSAATPRSTAPR